MLKKTSTVIAALLLAACSESDQQDDSTRLDLTTNQKAVSQVELLNANGNGAEWLTYNRTYTAQRHTPNTQITKENISNLGLSWYADLDTRRGQEATPLVIDGKLYLTTAWSKVKAFDAKTGTLLWEFDPQVPREVGVKACCDVVNRGLAAWDKKLYVGTLDGRLISLDRETGKPVWTTRTTNYDQPYTITGAPLVVDGKIIIGNGGAEMGVRGYITAYDAESGEQLWRFYTVPDNPANGPQPEYLETAVKTWKGEWWKLGGGGTVWDAMTYDPELNLLYIGVGNGSPWNQAIRSPGGGDNLYLSSIVALRPESGKYVWHFQTTPGETWDYTATQHIMLADLTIDGKQRKVLMQAPKNGFFYVLDRETGKFISGNNFVPMNWADGLDPNTGRPNQLQAARYDQTGTPMVVTPGAAGAHSWQSMAFDPKQGLVYIPANITAFPYIPEPDWEAKTQGFNVGVDMAAGAIPATKESRDAARAATNGALIAWDPVAQQERWRVDYPTPSNGGLLSTASGIVFQGTAGKEFVAYAADNGDKLWSFGTQTGIVAAPVSYTIDGDQYIAILAGWGGLWGLAPGAVSSEYGPVRNISRLLVFKLNGAATLPDEPPLNELPLDPPTAIADPAIVAAGAKLFGRFCGACHGDAAIGGGVIPDLRRSGFLFSAEAWKTVVYDGVLKDRGMVAWHSEMSAKQVESIRHYVIHRANEDKALALTQ